MNRRGHILCVLLTLFLLPGTSELGSSDDFNIPPYAERIPAIQLMPNWSDPITFGIAVRHEGKIVDLDYVSTKDFIMIFSGARKHLANPKGVNLFAKKGIQYCDVSYDKAAREHLLDCEGIQNLWKLRYSNNPYNQEEGEPGFAKFDSAPDDYQKALLQQFNIQRLNDFAVGEDAWGLMKAANNPQWISSYSGKTGW